MAELKVTYRPLAALTANRRNARTHDPRQIRQICDSIRTFGFTNPALVDEDGLLIAGHGRLEAARRIGLEKIPVIELTHLSEPQKRALMLADNKIALNAGWNMDLLATELSDLSEMSLDFSLDATGFEIGEIDLLIDKPPEHLDQPEIVEVPNGDKPALTKPGDLWCLGSHRVLCGNARSAEDLAFLLADEKVDCGFTDPPYNVPIRGHVSGKGRVQHGEFAEASGEMSSAEFQSFLDKTLDNAAVFSRPGAVWFVCTDWRHVGDMVGAGEKSFGRQLNLCVWCKTNGGMGSLYRSQHELVCVFANSGASHRNNVQLGRFGRNRTNVWHYPGVNTFREGRMEELHAHPTAKPVAMVKDALIDVTRRGDIILDPFGGVGATLMAAEQSGRYARLLEIDAAYVDTMLRRWRSATGEDPIRDADGLSFSTLEEEVADEQ